MGIYKESRIKNPVLTPGRLMDALSDFNNVESNTFQIPYDPEVITEI